MPGLTKLLPGRDDLWAVPEGTAYLTEIGPNK
jgi:hypothetical protein